MKTIKNLLGEIENCAERGDFLDAIGWSMNLQKALWRKSFKQNRVTCCGRSTLSWNNDKTRAVCLYCGKKIQEIK